jgi:uncharacterized protein with von Willebrand factor type A (vWA) domain
MRDLIYSIDKWTSYLWKRVVAESPVIQEHVARGKSKVPTFDSFAREVFARIYASPVAGEKTRPEDAWAKKLHEALDELPAFKKLTAHCAHDKQLASAAAATLLEQIVDRLPEPTRPLADPEERRREVRGLLDFLNGLSPSDPQRSEVERALADAKRAGTESVVAMSAIGNALTLDEVRSALRSTVDAAATDVEEFATASAGLIGLGSSSRMSEQTQAALGAALKSSDALKRLGMLAGRMRRIAMAKRRSRTKAAASELSDVTIGSDLARVLPSELLKLTDSVLALDFFRAFMERTLLQYELKGSEREGRGPIVVLIDDSDSMDGAPSTFAKAAALALADVALADKRACRLVRFSHRINGVLDMRAGVDATRSLLAFLSPSVDGGTNFELPLRAAREAIEREPTFERADVVMITDGEATLSQEFLSEWHHRAQLEGLTTYAIHIGARAPKVLHDLTGQVTELRSLLPERLEDALFGPIIG